MKSIKIMKGFVWVILILGTLYTLDVAKNLNFNWGEVFSSITIIPIVTIALPILVLFFTSGKSTSKEQDKKIQTSVLAIYLLIALALLAFLYYVIIHV
jgi:hypothetical protein